MKHMVEKDIEMKSSGFIKYMPVTEGEYQKFREVQYKQATLMCEELERPSILTPLVEMQNEKCIHYSSNLTILTCKSNAICIW